MILPGVKVLPSWGPVTSRKPVICPQNAIGQTHHPNREKVEGVKFTSTQSLRPSGKPHSVTNASVPPGLRDPGPASACPRPEPLPLARRPPVLVVGQLRQPVSCLQAPRPPHLAAHGLSLSLPAREFCWNKIPKTLRGPVQAPIRDPKD